MEMQGYIAQFRRSLRRKWMKRAILYVFSGTGNTNMAADRIARALTARGWHASIWDVRTPFFVAPDPREYDVVGFGYPVHAFNTPRFFLQFTKTLPKVEQTPAFIFKTSGEPFAMNSASSWPLARLLRKKGFMPILDRHLLMPYNIMFRYPDALAKQMAAHTKGMAEVIAEQVTAGRGQMPRYFPWTILWMYLFRLQWLGAKLNGPLLRAKKEICIGCGQCAATCPAENIQMQGSIPRFSGRYTMCMGCVFRCPVDAIRPGFLSAWRINGPYPFERLEKDAGVPDIYVDAQTKGYFRLFRPYYAQTYAEINALLQSGTNRGSKQTDAISEDSI